jgi:arylsulfatase A-like enzyme
LWFASLLQTIPGRRRRSQAADRPGSSVSRGTRILLAALLLVTAAACSCSKPDTRPNVLVIIIDTLRADYLGCYGADTDVTPNMNRLASEGARFSQCVTAVPVTLPSVSTILTSSYPVYHGVRDNGIFTLDQSLVTMAEVFKDEGYSTAAVVGAYVLTEGTGIEQGFEHYDDDFSGDYKLTSSLLPGRGGQRDAAQSGRGDRARRRVA